MVLFSLSLRYILGLIAVHLTIKALSIPYNLALLEGLAAARDQQARVAPRSPWYFFFRAFRRRLRWWKWVWLFLFCAVALLAFSIGTYSIVPAVVHMMHAALDLLYLAGSWWLVCASPLLWAPRCQRLWTLLLVSLLCELPALLVLHVIAAHASEWVYLFYDSSSGQFSLRACVRSHDCA